MITSLAALTRSLVFFDGRYEFGNQIRYRLCFCSIVCEIAKTTAVHGMVL